MSLGAIEQQAGHEGESWGPCWCCHGVTMLHVRKTQCFSSSETQATGIFFWYSEELVCFLQNIKAEDTKCLHLK